jgi:(p)ppGpp synthase/HD superfamily hydrolase
MADIKFNYDQYKTLEEKAKWFSYYHHGVTLHMYDGVTYHEGHLTRVAGIAQRFINWIPEEVRDTVLAACWLHDVIEDARVTYNDVKQLFGEDVAELVYAVTNEKGRVRKDRANHKYYHGILNTPYATFVKLCDRIANIEAGKEKGNSMIDAYRKEHAHFVQQLDDHFRYASMWTYMDELLA